MTTAAPTAQFFSRWDAALSPIERLGHRAWAERNIIIPQDYPCPPAMKGQYSAARHPIVHEVQDKLDLLTVREIVFVKPVQFGASQNILLPAALRALHYGLSVIFATSQQVQAETFRIERFIPLLRASPAFAGIKFHERDTEVYLDNGGLLTFIHNRSKGGVETRSAAVVLADEQDSFEFGIMERLRGRVTQFESISKIVIVSALKPNAKREKIDGKMTTPAMLEYGASSQARFHIADPGTGKMHPLEFGFPREDRSLPPWGLKWAKDCRRPDGTWNEARISETVHYVTPDGTTFGESARDRLLNSGRWIHARPEVADIKPGYILNDLYVLQKSFASIACGFLRAKRQGGEVYRTHMLEHWCETPWEEKITVTDRALSFLQAPYHRKQAPHEAGALAEILGKCPTKNVMGGDVQASRNGLWWLDAQFYDTRGTDPAAREKFRLGDEVTIAVRDWGHCFRFVEVDEASKLYKASFVGMDANYQLRRSETYGACLQYGFTPIIGRPLSKIGKPWDAQQIDPISGKSGKSTPLTQIIFREESLKFEVLEILNNKRSGIRIILPEEVDKVLVEQLTAERWIDGNPEQVRDDNHLLDCLIYAVLIGKFCSLLPV